jgi:hypothetical protein
MPRAGPRPGTEVAVSRPSAALVRGERSFTGILATEGWSADLGALRYLSHFVTPPASPIRFSARFFLCPVPAGQGPRLIAEEASEGFWVDPAEAHRRFRQGEWPMAEPAEYGTQYLAQFESYEVVWRHHADGRLRFDGIIDRLTPPATTSSTGRRWYARASATGSLRTAGRPIRSVGSTTADRGEPRERGSTGVVPRLRG